MIPSFKRAALLGLGVWLVPFVVAVLVFPFREPWRALFESIMAVTVAATTVGFGIWYLEKVQAVAVKTALAVGVLWYVECFVIDLLLFSSGPMEMTLVDYVADIGLTYVMIPMITGGLGLAAQSGRRTREGG